MKKIVIFGTGTNSKIASYFFENSDKFEIVAYCCDSGCISDKLFLGKEVVPWESVANSYPSSDFSMFVALGYHELNQVRTARCKMAMDLGYELVSYIPPGAENMGLEFGFNALVMDGAVLQPNVNVGNNVFIWGGAMIGHDSIIHDNAWITGGANIGGYSSIGESSFIGIGATVEHNVNIGGRCLIGSQCLIAKDLEANSVVTSTPSAIHRLNIDQFMRITNLF